MTPPDTTIRRIEHRLRQATGSWERIPHLIELSRRLNGRNPNRSRLLASEALKLSRNLNDNLWTARSYQALAEGQLWRGHFSEGFQSLEQAAALYDALADRESTADVQYMAGLTLKGLGRCAEATARLKNALEYFAARSDSLRTSRTYCALGDVSLVTGEHVEALRYFRTALTLSLKAGATGDPAGVYLHLASVYDRLDNRDRQQKCLRKSLELYRVEKNRKGIAEAITGLAELYIRSGSPGRAGRYIQRARGLFHELGCCGREAEIWRLTGMLARSQEATRSAEAAFRKGIQMAQSCEDQLAIGRLQHSFGLLQVETGNKREGMRRLQSALTILSEFGDPHHVIRLHETLAEVHEFMGDHAGALHHLKIGSEMRERYVGRATGFNMGRMEMMSTLRTLNRRLKKERKTLQSLREQLEEKEARLTSLTLNLLQRSEQERKLDSRSRSDSDGPDADDRHWVTFAHHFNKLQGGFLTTLARAYPTLTQSELKVCSLIRIGLSSQEIAELLCVSKRTIDRHRENLRKKFGLARRRPLAPFIRSI